MHLYEYDTFAVHSRFDAAMRLMLARPVVMPHEDVCSTEMLRPSHVLQDYNHHQNYPLQLTQVISPQHAAAGEPRLGMPVLKTMCSNESAERKGRKWRQMNSSSLRSLLRSLSTFFSCHSALSIVLEQGIDAHNYEKSLMSRTIKVVLVVATTLLLTKVTKKLLLKNLASQSIKHKLNTEDFFRSHPNPHSGLPARHCRISSLSTASTKRKRRSRANSHTESRRRPLSCCPRCCR